MNSRWRFIAAAAIAVALAYAAYRVVLHESRVQPAIITPSMNAQQAISPSLIAHVRRLFTERVEYGERNSRPRLIALTFDDGPYPIYTPLLLEELRRLRVPATFFLIGRDAQQWPELTQRVKRYGNELADHTYTHPNLDQLPPSKVRAEIIAGRVSVSKIVGDPALAYLFRPPHGRYTVATVQAAQSLRYDTVLWNDDSGDWRLAVTAQSLAEHLERHATAPEIVLLHSGRLPTIEMLRQIVSRFRAAGYRFVTVGELLARATPAELNHPLKRPV